MGMNDGRDLEHGQKADDDPFLRALCRASTLEPEELSPEDEAAIDEALNDDSDVSHAEALRLIRR